MSSTDPDKLPKQELLTKLLKMTTSSSDGEALAAIRRANSLLASAGWDWDKLISGKITVVADPFSSISDPGASRNGYAASARAPSPPPRPQPAAPSWNPTPPPAPPPRPTPPPPPTPYTAKQNIYSGYCFCCGIHVFIKDGGVIRPNDHNPRAPKLKPNGTELWAIICKACNDTRVFIPPSAAQRQKAQPGPAPSLHNL